MVMALIVLLGFGLLFMFAADDTERGGQSIESVISQQAKDLAGYQARAAHGRKTLDDAPARSAAAKELARVKRDSQTLQETITRLTKSVADGKAEIVRRNEAFETYKDEYRAFARSKAKGETMDKLETLTGGVYNDVIIREVTPVGIQIRHADGHKRIPFEELPEAMKDHFQFDPKQKDRVLADESATRNVLEAAVAVTDAMTDQAKVERRAAEAEEARNKTIAAISYKESRIEALENEIDSLKLAIAQEERKPVSKAPGMRFKVVDNGKAIVELRSQIATLRSRL